MDWLFKEPALVAGFISAVIALAISFGAQLSTDQVGGIMAVETALMAILVRSRVTPSG